MRAVTDGDLDTLESLVDKSLIRRSNDRFWMLATIREFALERLAESGERLELQRLHAEYFADLARRAGEELRGPEAARWLPELEQELDNLRAALAFSLETGEYQLALALSADLYRFWLAHGRASEGRWWLDDLVARAQSASPELRGTALRRASDMALWQGDYERAAEQSSQAVPLLREAELPAQLCAALITEGWAVGALGDRERALIVLEEALQHARERGFEMEEVSALNSLAALHKAEGDSVRALEFNEACLEIVERAGDPLNVAIVLGNVGESALGVGAHDRANDVLQRSLVLARELGDSRQADWVLVHLALASLLLGDTERSRDLFAESLPHAFEARDKRAMDVCLHGLAGVAAAAGDAERAARLWGAAEGLRESLGDEPGPSQRSVRRQYLAAAQAALGARFPSLEAEGRALTLEDAVALAGRDGQTPAERL